MNTNFNGDCLSGPCPPDFQDEQRIIYKSLVYTILAFLAICVVSYATLA